MRDLKLRVWNKETCNMCGEDTLQQMLYSYERDGHTAGIIDEANRALGNQKRAEALMPRESDYSHLVFLQYTGLKDSKRREIYEGDILLFGEAKRLVAWDRLIGRWIVEKFNGTRKHCIRKFSTDKWHNAEVIGNIYEEVKDE